MRRMIAAAALTMAVAPALAEGNVQFPVHDPAGQSVECTAFRHDPDGSWTTLKDLPVQRDNQFTSVAAGTTFKPGGPPLINIDLVALLNRVCLH